MTKYYLVVTEGGISISQKVSAVPGYSLHESGGTEECVRTSVANTDTPQQPFISLSFWPVYGISSMLSDSVFLLI